MKITKKYLAAAAQLGAIQPHDTKEQVVERMYALMQQAKSANAKLVVFPELCFTTFFPRYYFDQEADLDSYFEEECPLELISSILALIKDSGMLISFGYAEKEVHDRFNTSVILNSSGLLIGKYRKIHLPGHYEYEPLRPFQHLEKRYFQKGNLGFPTFSTEFGKLGMCICNDRRWPETFRVLALNGAEIVTLGYNTPKHYPLVPEHDHLQDFHNHLSMQGAAYANGIWIIASAKAGIEDGCELISGSCIISPTGEIVSESTTNNDELVLGEIDTNECLKIRENIFNFKLHRQPVEYEIISKQI